jgi:tetratricopeptide (TPR) repeat protein
MEKLLIKFDNKEGLGVVYANMANVLRLMPTRHADADKYYADSIKIAKNLLDDVEKILETPLNETEKTALLNRQSALRIAKAHRHMNRGVFRMEQGEEFYTKAHEDFNEAKTLHGDAENYVGLAMTSGINMS